MVATLNPVFLITGAASNLGDACANALAPRATGGLLLADADEAGLAATADALANAPERVSTLALDVGDGARWEQAVGFVEAQYGRIDFALLIAELSAMLVSLRAVMPLMAANVGGGAIVLIGAVDDLAGADDGANLLRIMRIGAKEGARDKIRVNALAVASAQGPDWRTAPSFADFVREQGDERGALARLTRQAPPLARLAATDIAEPLRLLMGDVSSVSGVALIVEGLYLS